jgi:adenylate cyclase
MATSRYIASVGSLSREEVADRAGVDAERVGELIDLGILNPDGDGSLSPGDIRRARLVDGLERAGLPLEALARALAGGDLSFAFFDLPLYERFAQLSGTTFQAMSERDRIPVELLMLIREAIGFAQPRAEDLMRDDELRVVPLIKLQLSIGFDPAVIEQWLRVYGESLRRVAETETAWWRSEIEAPQLASGMNEAEMLEEVANRWGEQIVSLTEQALLEIYHGLQEHAWTENLIEDVENALDRAGLRRRIEQPPAMCFLDLTGYTRLTEERGDEAAAELATHLARLVEQASDRNRGKVVKWAGDGVMLHFREPGSAVLGALEMIDDVARSGLPPAHVGLHAGPVVFQGGDYFGRTVNIASRIAEYARPGEVLVSQEVVEASDLRDVEVTEIGPVELKGVSEPLRIHSVRRRV